MHFFSNPTVYTRVESIYKVHSGVAGMVMLLSRCCQMLAVLLACASSNHILRVSMQWYHTLYVSGPGWLGGWEGTPTHDICAQISRTTSDLWIRNPQECVDMLSRKVVSHLIGLVVITLSLVIYQGISSIWQGVYMDRLLRAHTVVQVALDG